MSFGAMAMAMAMGVCTPVSILLPHSSLHTHRRKAASLSTLRVKRRTSLNHQPLTVKAKHTDSGDNHERAPCDCSEEQHHQQQQQQQQHQHHLKEEKKKTPATWEGLQYFSNANFCKVAREKQQELQERSSTSAQQLRCKVRRCWQIATRPQNLLAAFLAGLLVYAIALFGWQVMVVAVDVTLFVLKCSFAAILLLFMYIFLV